MTNVETGILYFFLIFGTAEVVTNLYHLTRGSREKVWDSARKQHQELPADLKAGHYVFKAAVMLVLGIIFLGVGILMLIGARFSPFLALAAMIMFGTHGLIQAIAYKKYWRVWAAAAVYNLPLIIYLVGSAGK